MITFAAQNVVIKIQNILVFVMDKLIAEGVYLFVDVNEDEIKRIVRVGTHTQSDNIGSRLKAHYKGSDSNSVFRKMLRNVLEKKLNSKIENKTVTEEIQKYKFVFIDTKGFSKDERLKTE